MDPVMLSRIQFGVSVGVHWVFPVITLGLTLIILFYETLYYKNNNQEYKELSTMLIKLLGLTFILGTATGIVLEFSFGTNWSKYSRIVGDIFGAPLAAEAIFSFFLESVFIGVLLFGRNRVSKKVYLLSAFLVFFGSHLSGLWIIIANSWMQTPAGFSWDGERAVLTNIFDASFNPSTLIRYVHTILSSWLVGGVLIIAIGAWYLIKKRHISIAKNLLKFGIILFLFTSLAMIYTGHSHSVQVAKTNPEKMAAFEALWKTQKGAPLALFGLPDEDNQTTHLFIGLPKMLSFLIDFDFDSEIKGLDSVPEDERPPVLVPFMSYHIMIILGSFFVGFSLLLTYLMIKNKLWDNKLILKLAILISPLPILTTEFGWIAAEVGRQPWIVYKIAPNILKTKDAISLSVPPEQVLFSLIMFSGIYLLFLIGYIIISLKMINKGPAKH